jgi:hypothetical protein
VTVPPIGPAGLGEEVDALVVDRYIELLLGGSGTDPAVVALTPRDLELDAAIAAAAAAIAAGLVPASPSVRCVERLAARLAETGSALADARSGGRPPASIAALATAGGHGDPFGPDPERTADLARPLLIGGAITSAAISLAGAAWFARRRRRPGAGSVVATRLVRFARRPVGAATPGGPGFGGLG